MDNLGPGKKTESIYTRQRLHSQDRENIARKHARPRVKILPMKSEQTYSADKQIADYQIR